MRTEYVLSTVNREFFAVLSHNENYTHEIFLQLNTPQVRETRVHTM